MNIRQYFESARLEKQNVTVSIGGVYKCASLCVISQGNKQRLYELGLDPIMNYNASDGRLDGLGDVLELCYRNGCNDVDDVCCHMNHLSKYFRMNLGSELCALSSITAKDAAIQAGNHIMVDDMSARIPMQQHEIPTKRAITVKLEYLHQHSVCFICLFVCLCKDIGVFVCLCKDIGVFVCLFI